jgi:hypothetical protein
MGRATLQEDGRANARPIGDGILLDIEDKTFVHESADPRLWALVRVTVIKKYHG